MTALPHSPTIIEFPVPEQQPELPGLAPSGPETVNQVLSLLDYSREVETLVDHPDKVWQSADMADFRQTGKINFLRVQSNGFILLDVFKPGCHFTEQVFIGAESAQETKRFLVDFPLQWDTKSAGWKRRDGQLAESSTLDALFKFTRVTRINETHQLIWK